MSKEKTRKNSKKKIGKKWGKNGEKNALAAIRIANQPFPGTFSSDDDQNAPSTTEKQAKKQIGIRMWTFQTVRKTSVMKQVLFCFLFVCFFRVPFF